MKLKNPTNKINLTIMVVLDVTPRCETRNKMVISTQYIYN